MALHRVTQSKGLIANKAPRNLPATRTADVEQSSALQLHEYFEITFEIVLPLHTWAKSQQITDTNVNIEVLHML